jgi:protein-S-isoprenylcysteine O-methyltransferase Ste14
LDLFLTQFGVGWRRSKGISSFCEPEEGNVVALARGSIVFLSKGGCLPHATHGLFAEHPVAADFVLENWLAGRFAVVTSALLYFVRTPREEEMMCEVFGQVYRDYRRQNARLLPRPNVE